MLLAQSFSGLETILLGLLILVTAFLLRRTVLLSGRSRHRDILSEVRDEVRDAEDSNLAYFRKLEIRLHDLAREVEGRTQTHIHVLEQLVADADQRIDELRQGLAATSEQHANVLHKPSSDDGCSAILQADNERTDGSRQDESVSCNQTQILNLAQAGFRADEIAHCVVCSEQEVRKILEGRSQANRTDAA